MDPLPIIAFTAMATLYGLTWHNQPARTQFSARSSGETFVKARAVIRPKLWISGFVVATVLVGASILWTKSHATLLR